MKHKVICVSSDSIEIQKITEAMANLNEYELVVMPNPKINPELMGNMMELKLPDPIQDDFSLLPIEPTCPPNVYGQKKRKHR